VTFSPFDSPIYGALYGDKEVRALFTDSGEVRALLLVEGVLAKVQGDLGLIPLDSALYIHRASMECQVDPAGLATGMATDGNPIPALVAAFAKAMEAPEHAKYIHFEVDAQDVIDTALTLRLRQYIRLIEAQIAALNSENLQLSSQMLTALKPDLLVARTATGKVSSALATALKLGIVTPTTPNARHAVAKLTFALAAITTALAESGQGAAPTVVATMAQYNAIQSNLLQQALLKKTGVGLALERMTLAQVCIATAVALRHAQP
jgi:3-carboxy-cis,cis-muconate cycloisomerase